MRALVGTLALAATAALLFSLVAGSVSRILAPRRLRSLATLAPVDRARALFRLGVAPAVASLFATWLCFLPSVANLIGLGHDHCLHHDDDHLHFCFVHHPMMRGVIEPAVLMALLIGGVWLVIRELDGRRRVRELIAAGDSAVPFAATVGRLAPRIILSRRLCEALAPAQLAAVRAHEEAHVVRRDTLWRALVELLSLAHWPSIRRRILSAYAVACERACDEAAALRVGDRIAVAEAILAAERLLPAAPTVAAGLSDCDAEERVGALLADPVAAEPSRSRLGWVAVIVAVALVFADPLHHLTETILGFLIR